MFNRKFGFLAAALLVGAMAMPVMAQPAPDNGGGNNNAGGNAGGGGGGGGRQRGGGGGGGGNFNPGQWRQQMMDQLKTELGATDEEFTALQPKIEKIQQLQRDIQPRGGRGGPGGFGGRRGNQDQANGGAAGATADPNATDLQAKLKELQDALANKDTPADTIKTKLTAYRDAKTAAKADLVKAQEDLKGILTQRQEAVMVTRNVLD